MKKPNNKFTFSIFLIIIISFNLSFLLIPNYIINTSIKNNFEFDDLNPNASEITVTSLEPGSGYYPATFGFENDIDGSNPAGFNVHEGAGYVNVIGNKNDHIKVIEMYDGSSGDHTELHQVFQSQTYGTVEFWILNDDVSDTFSIRLLESAAVNVWGDGIGWIQIWQDTLRYLEDSDWDVTSKVISDDIWYHIKIEFECAFGNYQGLAQDTWRFYVDGEAFGDFPFLNDISNVGQIYFAQRGADNHYRCYVDAIGYSWDPNYNVGDNVNEGQYPPDTPLTLGGSNLILLILNCLGLGIIVILGITLFLFTKHNRSKGRV